MKDNSNFFAKCNSLYEIKVAYKLLAMHYHQNRGGDSEKLKKVNQHYFQVKDNPSLNFSSLSPDDQADFLKFPEILDKIICFEITIELIGDWIWLNGLTFDKKELLKKLGFLWSPHRHQWYLMPTSARKARRHYKSMEQIREQHGSDQTSPNIEQSPKSPVVKVNTNVSNPA